MPTPRPIKLMRPEQSVGRKGMGPFAPIATVPKGPRFTLSGVTRDGSGLAVGNCDIKIVRQSDDVVVQRITSDVNGNYSSDALGPGSYQVLAYKAGTPQLVGATINTLQPAQQP